MDAVELLKDFAKLHNIDVKEVDKFLEQFENPKTLNDVLNLPHDLQYHEDYVTWLPDELQRFIMDELYHGERYETLEVDRLADFLEDRILYLLDETDEEIYVLDVDIDTLTTSNEKNKERLEYLKSIAQLIIDIKFGSVVIDW